MREPCQLAHFDDHNDPLTMLSRGQKLAEIIREVTGFEGCIVYDRSKPDGTPRKLMDSSRLRALGWQPALTLSEGISKTYAWFRANQSAMVAAL